MSVPCSRLTVRAVTLPRVLLALCAVVLGTVVTASPRAAAATPSVWISGEELAELPTSGAAWDRVHRMATEPLPTGSDLGVRDDHNVRTLAAALVSVRLGDEELRSKAVQGLRTVVEARPTDDLLAASRRLGTYVIAADVLDLARLDPALHDQVHAWAGRELTRTYGSGSGGAETIVQVHERRPNNWGTHAGASRMAVAIYRGDHAELERAAEVFRAWLGDRAAHDGFRFGALDWQADGSAPVGINPKGARLEGQVVDGVLPDDQRRGGGFTWPPPKENYVWEALQGATVQAQLLHRQGHDAWGWQDRALHRAVTWLHDVARFPAVGDDTWIPHLVNHATASEFPTETSRPGKNMGFTDWTHAGTATAPPVTEPPAEDPPAEEPPAQDPPADEPGVEPGPGEPAPPATPTPPRGPHAESIAAVLAAGIAEGYPDGSFRPERPVTRAQMASFLARAVGLEGRDGASFEDTAVGTHARAIEAVAAAGIAEGYADGTFRPQRPVTRAQMASFLARAVGLEGRDGASFTDTGGTTHAPAIEAVAATRIAEGYDDGTFRPAREVTRAQMASFLARAFELQ